MKETIIGVMATAGVAFALACIVGWGLTATNADAVPGLFIVGGILACGVIAAILWPAMDNPYTKWVRGLSEERGPSD